MITHLIDGLWRLATRACDSRVVEQDHGAALRKAIRDVRIPIVQTAAEVLKKDERRATLRTKASVCVTNCVRLNEQGWGGEVSVVCHTESPELSATVSFSSTKSR